MFLDPKFFCFNFSTILLFIWYVVPYFSITDHLLRYNYTETDGANLISVIGVFNTIGMVILGYIGDKPWLDVPKTYAACLIGKYGYTFIIESLLLSINRCSNLHSLRHCNSFNANVRIQLYLSADIGNDLRHKLFQLIFVYSDTIGAINKSK